jgi:NDP-sugar pyrophosphorylase family protein
MTAKVDNLVVLAGGAGTRMGEGATGVPKHLLEVGGRPLLLSAIDQMCAEFAIERVTFRVAYQADVFVGRWSAGGLPVPVRSSVLVGRLNDGPIGALADTSSLLRGQRVLFSGGDVYYRITTFQTMVTFHDSHRAPMTVGVARSVPTRRPSTLVPSADGSLDRWERKPISTSTDLINASLYLVDTDRIGWLKEDWESTSTNVGGQEYREDNLWQLILHRPDRARLFELDGVIVNVNTQDQLEAAKQLSLDPRVVFGMARRVGREDAL